MFFVYFFQFLCFLYFLSFLFPGLFCLWVVYLFPAVLSDGVFIFCYLCKFVSRCRFRVFRSVTCSSRVSFSSCNFFIVFMLFFFSMFEFLVCCRFSVLILSVSFLISLSSFFHSSSSCSFCFNISCAFIF